jgi:hypothetical protein
VPPARAALTSRAPPATTAASHAETAFVVFYAVDECTRLFHLGAREFLAKRTAILRSILLIGVCVCLCVCLCRACAVCLCQCMCMYIFLVCVRVRVCVCFFVHLMWLYAVHVCCACFVCMDANACTMTVMAHDIVFAFATTGSVIRFSRPLRPLLLMIELPPLRRLAAAMLKTVRVCVLCVCVCV